MVIERVLPADKKNIEVLAITECSQNLIERAYKMSSNVKYENTAYGLLKSCVSTPTLRFEFSDKSQLNLLIKSNNLYKPSHHDVFNLKTNAVQNLYNNIAELNKEIDILKQEIITDKDKKISELEAKLEELAQKKDSIKS